jgi:5-methyltetrahydropteroyltriglutamate--homocysteine methyltransferase
MTILTEPIGSIPRPSKLIDALQTSAESRLSASELSALADAALSDTIARFEATGSPVITDGEQTKPSFATYPNFKVRRFDDRFTQGRVDAAR